MHRFVWIFFFIACLLSPCFASATDQATIQKNVDAMVAAINSGTPATSFPADAYTPYAFIMAPNGRLVVHPNLKGEYLQEKAAPIHDALQKATTEGTWVTYFWKGAAKQTYVKRTNNDLVVGSGY